MIQMTRTQYDSLMALALLADETQARALQRVLDTANGISRYFLYIRWQDVGGTAPVGNDWLDWPSTSTYQLEIERAISRADVDEVLEKNAANPVAVYVTPDRGGELGWTELEAYDFSRGV